MDQFPVKQVGNQLLAPYRYLGQIGTTNAEQTFCSVKFDMVVFGWVVQFK